MTPKHPCPPKNIQKRRRKNSTWEREEEMKAVETGMGFQAVKRGRTLGERRKKKIRRQ
jgi:hypothetical protein